MLVDIIMVVDVVGVVVDVVVIRFVAIANMRTGYHASPCGHVANL
jgi:hypothetical protein